MFSTRAISPILTIKIMRTAAELGEDISVLSQRYAQAYFEDMAALNNLEPTITPYATQHIPEMIDMIETVNCQRPCLRC